MAAGTGVKLEKGGDGVDVDQGQEVTPSSEKEHSLLQATDAPLGAFPFQSRPSHLSRCRIVKRPMPASLHPMEGACFLLFLPQSTKKKCQAKGRSERQGWEASENRWKEQGGGAETGAMRLHFIRTTPSSSFCTVAFTAIGQKELGTHEHAGGRRAYLHRSSSTRSIHLPTGLSPTAIDTWRRPNAPPRGRRDAENSSFADDWTTRYHRRVSPGPGQSKTLQCKVRSCSLPASVGLLYTPMPSILVQYLPISASKTHDSSTDHHCKPSKVPVWHRTCIGSSVASYPRVPYECRYEKRAARRRSCCFQAYFPSGAVRQVTVRCPQLASRRWYIRALACEARRGEPGAIFCSFRANLASTFPAIIADITLGLGGVPLIIQVGTPGIQCLDLKLKLKPLLVTDTRVAVSRCTVSESLKATPKSSVQRIRYTMTSQFSLPSQLPAWAIKMPRAAARGVAPVGRQFLPPGSTTTFLRRASGSISSEDAGLDRTAWICLPPSFPHAARHPMFPVDRMAQSVYYHVPPVFVTSPVGQPTSAPCISHFTLIRQSRNEISITAAKASVTQRIDSTAYILYDGYFSISIACLSIRREVERQRETAKNSENEELNWPFLLSFFPPSIAVSCELKVPSCGGEASLAKNGPTVFVFHFGKSKLYIVPVQWRLPRPLAHALLRIVGLAALEEKSLTVADGALHIELQFCGPCVRTVRRSPGSLPLRVSVELGLGTPSGRPSLPSLWPPSTYLTVRIKIRSRAFAWRQTSTMTVAVQTRASVAAACTFKPLHHSQSPARAFSAPASTLEFNQRSFGRHDRLVTMIRYLGISFSLDCGTCPAIFRHLNQGTIGRAPVRCYENVAHSYRTDGSKACLRKASWPTGHGGGLAPSGLDLAPRPIADPVGGPRAARARNLPNSGT
ncbi:uncharacterized protein CLUP02_01623 [Colletotrichum lupini]|uniref:Uncharacterized protein n=1 Tax=Colletotrichum lupini TaxID=145971 RepID=A0A9Q8SD15_9PEZI|nr:uncharacterized protein CLUP02_01623 [Colletotrichum lupini]UQC74970.1 hypothetical protein CLUP02_01623 [Colletotrichum lupini]